MQPNAPTIFLSSTYLDLHGVREELRRWLSGVFGAAMEIMESSGSDAEPPNIVSVRRVRTCDLFVGIYAHRYGTIDPSTGESITELELDEARTAYSAGVIKSILLYVVEEGSAWLSEFKDQSPEAKTGRARLHEKLLQHTYTPFRSPSHLLFSVMRDVYRIIASQFPTEERKVKSINVPPQRKLSRPIGMEFLTSADRAYLVGREKEIDDCVVQLEKEPIALMLGESGVGKTSLLHAGVIPEATRRGWRPVYARPFGMPCRNIIEQIESSLFSDARRSSSLLGAVAGAITALHDVPLLLLIDQFEDVLGSQSDGEIDDLLSGLAALRELSPAGLRLLISYRSDLEGRLGAIWQRVSGSPRGFPRIYVTGVRPEAMWPGIRTFCDDLGVNLQLGPAEAQRISGDIVALSRELIYFGVYPPYIQMLLDCIWHSQNADGVRRFSAAAYETAGGIVGIINRYLSQQLQYANDATGQLRLLLIALVKSYGVKAQRTLQELAADTGIDTAQCEAHLERLIDFRLVRHISDRYEVSHDFLAKMILDKLVDLEEREFKRFRELLSSRAVAFTSTSNRLSIEEVLFLYKYRQRVALTAQEAALVLDTWIMEDVPGLFWIKDFDANTVDNQLRMANYQTSSLEPEQAYSIAFLKTSFRLGFTEDDFLALLRIYKIASEAARMIRHHGRTVPARAILFGLRNWRVEIRDACFDVVVGRMQDGDFRLLNALRNRRANAYADAYFRLALDARISTAPIDIDAGKELLEFAHLQRIARAESPRSAKRNLKLLSAMRPTERARHFGRALAKIRSGHTDEIIAAIRRSSALESRPYIAALATVTGRENFDKVLALAVSLNRLEKDRDLTPAICDKLRGLGEVIRRLSSSAFMPSLRHTLKQIRLTPSSRDISASILTNGEPEDIAAVLIKIAEADDPAYYQNQTEICDSLRSHLRGSDARIPEQFIAWMNSENFWKYMSAADRRAAVPGASLPIRNYENRLLFIRVLANAIIGLARSADDDALRRLIDHEYRTVSRPAAERLTELIGEPALQILAGETDQAVRSGRGSALAEALRVAERIHYAEWLR